MALLGGDPDAHYRPGLTEKISRWLYWHPGFFPMVVAILFMIFLGLFIRWIYLMEAKRAENPDSIPARRQLKACDQ
jgi:hypothetical protein